MKEPVETVELGIMSILHKVAQFAPHLSHRIRFWLWKKGKIRFFFEKKGPEQDRVV